MRNSRSALPLLCVLLAAVAPAVAEEAPPPPPDVAAPPADAEVTSSGLASKVLATGTGTVHPGPNDQVVVHYSGWTTDGKLFDSSIPRGAALRLPLDSVIDGWTEGLQLMVEGEKRRFWIPEELAYAGLEDRPQGMLVFDVELLTIHRKPVAPPDVAAPPADADVLRSGLATKVLEPGTGTLHPKANSTVLVDYSGWTTDGEMFDSSFNRMEAATLPLNSVIKGWSQGLQLMVEGEKRRLWIPEKLAYRGKKDKPQGMLVFDVELVQILGSQRTE